MIRVFRRISKCALVAVLALPMLFGQAKPEPQWKDNAEFEMYNAAQNAKDAKQKLAALDAWKQKYPDTNYKMQRLALYLNAYQQLNDFPKLIETLDAVLALNPKDLQVMNGIMFYAMQSDKPDAAGVDRAQKVAHAALDNLDVKPAGVTDAQWPEFRKNVEALAHTTLGWAAMNQKNVAVAEDEFGNALKINPNMGKVDLMLATALWSEKTPANVSKALFYYTRAAVYDGQGTPLDPAARKQLDGFVDKAYKSYHGAADGLDELKTLARTQAFPPDGFAILSAQQVALQNQQKLQQENPQLAMWLNLKQTLSGATGAEFFNSNMKGAEVPGGAGGVQMFRGTLISASPALHPKELVVGIADAKTPEVTLKLDTPLAGKPQIGSEIEFEGVPEEFTAEPFHVTFAVERAKIKGLKVVPAAGTKRRASR